MTGTRRILALLVAVVPVVLVATPAQAAFSGKSPALAASVGTVTVAAPSTISTAGTWCDAWTMHARVSWKASTTAQVGKNTITAYLPTGAVVAAFDTAADATAMTMDVPREYATYGIRITVTATTTYSWTAESLKSGVITC